MKEMTIESKSRFFAMYYGQAVYRLDGLSNLKSKPFETPMDGDHLELTALEDITAADCRFINELEEWNYEDIDSIRNVILNCLLYNRGATKVHQYDYLRSKGYALPFMGWTVEEMVKAGWIKLKAK